MADQYYYNNGGQPEAQGGPYAQGGQPQPGPQQPYGQQQYAQQQYAQQPQGQAQYAQAYTQPTYQGYAGAPPIKDNTTLGDWIVTYLLMMLPIANIVLLFIWAFGSTTGPSKKNWARATLIFMAIGLVLGIIAMAAVIDFMTRMPYWY